MKVKILFIIPLLLISNYVLAQSADDEIVYLINSGDYLQLNQRFSEEKQNIQRKTVSLIAEAYIHSAFNRPEEAVNKLHELISKHQDALVLNEITACMLLLCENLRYQGKFFTASDLAKSYVDQTDTFNGLDENVRNLFTGLYALKVLGDGMKPEIQRPFRDCEIQIIENNSDDKMIDHFINVNATINGKEVIIGLDTGCDAYGTNFISEKFARENGIRIFNDSILLSGVSTGYAKIGKADQIKIGDIIYKNVTFTIAPGDNIFPVDSFQLDAILGSAFFKAVGECQFFPKEKKIVFPIRQTNRPVSGSNMFLKEGQPYVQVFTEEERLLMLLTTGRTMDLSPKYFAEHEEEIKASGTLKTGGGLGGYGGLKYLDKYMLKDFPVEINNRKIVIPQIDVMTEKEGIISFDGTLGSDILKYFNKITINFNQMFMLAE